MLLIKPVQTEHWFLMENIAYKGELGLMGINLFNFFYNLFDEILFTSSVVL